MNLKIDWLANMWTQGNHRRIEALEMSDLQDGVSFFRRTDHAVSFLECSRDRFFNQDVNAGFEQAARDLAVRFRRNGDTRSVDVSDQVLPVGGPICLSFTADRAGG